MQAADQLSVLFVGDRFVPASLLADHFGAHAERHGLAFSGRELQLSYPTAPAIPLSNGPSSRSVRAFWEEIEAIEARRDVDASDPALREYTGPVDQLVPEVGGVDVLLVHAAPVSRAVIGAATSLRAVGTVRTGPVNVNVAELSARGIPLFNTPGRNAQAVAEFIAGALITHVRGIIRASQLLRDSRWSLEPWAFDAAGVELGGRTCGLVGFGKVGQAFSRIALGIGMKLLVSDPFVDDAEISAAGATPCALAPLLEQSDFVVVVARLTSENHHLIDARALDRMKSEAILVNTARSQLVDSEALARALRDRRIAGAIVDVFDQEPPSTTDTLVDVSPTLLTPHIAGASRDTVVRGADILGASVTGFLATGSLENCLNRGQIAVVGGQAAPAITP